MTITEKAEREYMIWSERARTSVKYSTALANLVKDIVENGESFSRMKWEAIYKNKETPWRQNKVLQELMVKTKGFPDDLCEKILSCSFNKRVYKAALSRSDIGYKNIDIALTSLSERELTQSLLNKEIGMAAINKITQKVLNKLSYDAEAEIKDYEIAAIAQTNDEDTVKSFLENINYGYVNEELLVAIINNLNLSADTRNLSFDLGCNPLLISTPYTEYMQEVILSGILMTHYDNPNKTTGHFIDMMENNLIDEAGKEQVLDMIIDHYKTHPFKNDSVLTVLLKNTTQETIFDKAINKFPQQTIDNLFFNPNLPLKFVDKHINDAIQGLMSQPLLSTIMVEKCEAARVMLSQNIENRWKDIEITPKTFDKIIEAMSPLRASKLYVALTLANSPKSTEKFLQDFLNIKEDTSGYTNFENEALKCCKVIAFQTLSLKQNKISYNTISSGLYNLNYLIATNAIFNNKTTDITQWINDNIVPQENFTKYGQEYINALKSLQSLAKEYKTPDGLGDPDIIKTYVSLYDVAIAHIEKELLRETAFDKPISTCTKEEVNALKEHYLSLAGKVSTTNPVKYFLSFEDNKSKYIEICSAEHNLDKSKEAFPPINTLVENILDTDGTVFVEAVSNNVSSPISPPTHNQDVFEI